MSGCEEEAMAITYATNELIDEILYYIDCNCCNPCSGNECLQGPDCKVEAIKNYLHSKRENYGYKL